MRADFSPTLGTYSGQGAFRYWCQQVLPLTFDDSISYIELLAKVVKYLNNMREDVATAETNIDALNTAFNELQDYVNDYFDDLNVDNAISIKLDRMAQDGSLGVVVEPFVRDEVGDEISDVVAEQIDGVVSEQIDGSVSRFIDASVGEQIDASVAGQLAAVVANQISGIVAQQIDAVVADQIEGVVVAQFPTNVAPIVTGWLNDNVTPVGSAVVVDESLSIGGAAADAKVVGNDVKSLNAIREWNGKNYLNFSTAIVGYSIDSSGNMVVASSPTVASIEEYLPIEAEKSYIISNNGTEKSVLVIAFYDNTKTFISRLTEVSRFTTPADTTYYRITTRDDGVFPKGQIEEGSVVTDFKPYWIINSNYIDNTDYTLDIKALKSLREWNGKNYLNFYSALENISINSSGNLVSSASNGVCSTEDYLPIEGGYDYVISNDGASKSLLVVAFYNSNKNFISRVTDVTSFTAPNSAAYIRVTTQADGVFAKGQIEKGNVVTKFTPYWKANEDNFDVVNGIADRTIGISKIDDNFVIEEDRKINNYRIIKEYESGLGFMSLNVSGNVENHLDVAAQHHKTYSVSEGCVYFYTGTMYGSARVLMATFLDDAGNVIGHNGIYSTTTNTKYEDYPIVPVPGTSSMIICSFDDVSLKGYKNDNYGNSEINFFGHNEVPKIDADLNYIVFYGQSLSVGADSKYIVDKIEKDCYMLGSSLETPSAAINPLVLSSNGQQPVVSCVNSLHKLIWDNKNAKPTLVCGSYGSGGKSIAQLMSATRQAVIKQERDFAYDIVSGNNYSLFSSAVEYANTYAQNNKKSIKCPAIVFLQGERDFFSDAELEERGAGDWQAYACGNDKELYKTYMARLKYDMQAKIMTTFNQTEKPIFFIYEVSGNFISKKDMNIITAQREFANENNDVVLLPATYFTPNYNNGHLSTNGYRWYGEVIAKAIYDTCCCRNKYLPMSVSGIRYDSNNIYIKVANIVQPLVIDNYTVEEKSNYGFKIWKNNTLINPNKITLYGDEIILTFSSTISDASSLEIQYAGMETSGTGNVRDSSNFVAMYDFKDESADHGASGTLNIVYTPVRSSGLYLTGEKYPMWNWLEPYSCKLI